MIDRKGRARVRAGNFNFSDEVGAALETAIALAHRQEQPHLTPEHLLFGLTREADGTAKALLGRLEIDTEELSKAIAALPQLSATSRARDFNKRPNYSSGFKSVLKSARFHAEALAHTYVGAEHILLGIATHEGLTARKLLSDRGATEIRLRNATLEWLGFIDPLAVEAVLEIGLDEDSDLTIPQQIISFFEEAIATRRLLPNQRLPAVRKLAGQLQVAPRTVACAYRLLEQDGLVVTDGARGTRVAQPTGLAGDAALGSRLTTHLRSAAVRAFHEGVEPERLRAGLEEAMRGIFD